MWISGLQTFWYIYFNLFPRVSILFAPCSGFKRKKDPGNRLFKFYTVSSIAFLGYLFKFERWEGGGGGGGIGKKPGVISPPLHPF